MEIKPYPKYNEEEILSLYRSVGWTAYTDQPERLRLGFEGSLSVLAAYEGERLLGIVRAVGDGQTVVLIQDILVFPQFQRRGVGSALLEAMLTRYRDVRQIELFTDDTPGTLAFYKSMGLRECSELGCCGLMK